MIIKANHPKIRYTGRWNIGEESARTSANGNYFEFMYSGECAVLGFDISYARIPFPRVYISVDGGANIESTIDRYIRISADEGIHKVCVTMKCSYEKQHRWYEPIESIFTLLDIEADEFLDLPEDTRPIIEFIGDSITEGTLIDVERSFYGDMRDLIYKNDSMADFPWLVAKELNIRPIVMGYGCLGVTKEGAGGVPLAAEAYQHYSNGYPMESLNADYIVINYGTNDMFAETEHFKEKYIEFLAVVRKRNPKSKIIALTPFGGHHAGTIGEVVEQFNKENNDDIFYINSSDWIPDQPMHPLRDGHKIVCKKLSEILRREFMVS